MKHHLIIAAAVATVSIASPASANGIALEANAARSHGEWGTELGAGVDLGSGAISLRPMMGAFVADDTRLYVKGEATVTIPAVAEVGAGARLIGDHVRAYGTASVPLAPKLRLKGNLGEGYGALGITLRL